MPDDERRAAILAFLVANHPTLYSAMAVAHATGTPATAPRVPGDVMRALQTLVSQGFAVKSAGGYCGSDAARRNAGLIT